MPMVVAMLAIERHDEVDGGSGNETIPSKCWILCSIDDDIDRPRRAMQRLGIDPNPDPIPLSAPVLGPLPPIFFLQPQFVTPGRENGLFAAIFGEGHGKLLLPGIAVDRP